MVVVSDPLEHASIQHTVVFRLVHPAGSAAEQDFLAAARALGDIPGVEDFRRLRQVSRKSSYTFYFSMHFADEAAYQAYNEHPTHVAFVRDRWDREVADFAELDFVTLE